MSATSEIRERLLSGEQLGSALADQMGVSRSTFTLALKALKEEGHEFTEEAGERNTKLYQLVGAASNGNGRGDPHESPRPAVRKVKLPDLGDVLTVTSLMYDQETGEKRVVLSGEKASDTFILRP